MKDELYQVADINGDIYRVAPRNSVFGVFVRTGAGFYCFRTKKTLRGAIGVANRLAGK
jgi:hypothetical protein